MAQATTVHYSEVHLGGIPRITGCPTMKWRTAGRGGSKHFALRQVRFEVESEGGNPTVGLVSLPVVRVGSPTPMRSSSDRYMRDYHRASDPSSPTGGCKQRR